jgi:autotransporter-associated beta strand protein
MTQNFVTAVDLAGHQGVILFTNSATAGSFTTFASQGGVANLVNGGLISFAGNSNAGSSTFINEGSNVGESGGGFTTFSGASTAANGTFVNNPGTNVHVTTGAGGGLTFFVEGSNAENATITNNGVAVSGAQAGSARLNGTASAGNATITNNGATVSGFLGSQGGLTAFMQNSAAGSGTIIANTGTGGGAGGDVSFEGNSDGGTSRIECFGNGYLDISLHNAPGVVIGSVEGDGNVFLGGNNLSVGSNNLNTSCSGVIWDGRPHMDRGALKVYDSTSSNRLVIQDGGLTRSEVGSFTKIGWGTLDLEGVNTYSGDTNVNGGVLQIDGSISSNTFINPGGTLAGSGTINGNITNSGGKISPGEATGVPGTLTVGGNYTARTSDIAGGTLSIQIGGANVGQVSVLDVQGHANLGGFLDPVLLNGFVPEVGQSFTFLNYASFTGRFGIRNPVFDHGRRRWSVSYGPTSAVLTAVKNLTRD